MQQLTATYLASTKSSNRTNWSSIQTEFWVDTKLSINFHQFFGRPYLDWFYLMRGLSLDAISCHHCLETHGFSNQYYLYHKICGSPLLVEYNTTFQSLGQWRGIIYCFLGPIHILYTLTHCNHISHSIIKYLLLQSQDRTQATYPPTLFVYLIFCVHDTVSFFKILLNELSKSFITMKWTKCISSNAKMWQNINWYPPCRYLLTYLLHGAESFLRS